MYNQSATKVMRIKTNYSMPLYTHSMMGKNS